MPAVGWLWPGDDDGGGDRDDDDDVDNDDDVDDKGGCSIALILLTASAGLQIYVSQKVFFLRLTSTFNSGKSLQNNDSES